jgi:hypothetical protein
MKTFRHRILIEESQHPFHVEIESGILVTSRTSAWSSETA